MHCITTEERLRPMLAADKTWCLGAKTFAMQSSRKKKVEMIKEFDFLFHHGKVDLNTPDIKFWILAAAQTPKEFVNNAEENRATKAPHAGSVYHFVREVAHREKSPLQEIYSLKKRKYIGPTSCDARLAFVMNNLARVKPGSMVLDPFMGTGSLVRSATVAMRLGHYVLFLLLLFCCC
jgi:tRNA (guanine10-N2)-methyltransferase